MDNADMSGRTFLKFAFLALAVGCHAEAEQAPSPPNIIMISLDTLRADRVGAFGGPPGLTPNLDRLAAESWTFTHTYAQSTETLFSHASLFSGRYASELSTVDYHFSYPENVPTMAEILALYGYKTGGSVAGGHLSPVFGLGQGFQHYAGPEEWGSLWHTAPAGLGWTDGLDSGPFFLFIHGYDTHSRYLKPSPVGYMYANKNAVGPGQRVIRSNHGTSQVVDGKWYPRQRFNDLVDLEALRPHTAHARKGISADKKSKTLSADALDQIRKVYDGAVTYTDLQVGLLMGELERRKLLENSWIIVLSDHGEELGENGYFNHRLNMSEELLRVPLLIRPPGGLETGQVSTELTGLIDLLPTVLEITDVPAPAGMAGHSLLPIMQGKGQTSRAAVFAEGPWRIIGGVSKEGGLIFSGLSPHSKSLAPTLSATPLTSPAFETWGKPDKSSLLKHMTTWRAGLTAHTPRPSADSEARRKILQDRGYWGGP